MSSLNMKKQFNSSSTKIGKLKKLKRPNNSDDDDDVDNYVDKKNLNAMINDNMKSDEEDDDGDSDAEEDNDDGDGDGEENNENDKTKVFNLNANLKLQKELSTMSFDDLMAMKSKLGTKVFNATAFCKSNTKPSENVKSLSKKRNKNKPAEVSSKMKVKQNKSKFTGEKFVPRDPRFDEMSGSFNKTYFKQAYSFVDNIKQNEKQKLLKSFKKEKDPEKKHKIESLLTRLKQQEKCEKELNEKHKKEKELKKIEKEKVLQGKSPFYLKKAVKRKLEQEEKIKTLHEKGKLQKYMKKKEKKLLSKDRKHLPFL